MSPPTHDPSAPPPIGLDNPALHDRLRPPAEWQLLNLRPGTASPRRNDYTTPVNRPVPQSYRSAPTTPPPAPNVPAPPATLRRTAGPSRQFIRETHEDQPPSLHSHNRSRLQISLVGLAGLVFMIGLVVSFQAWQTNNNVASQVSAQSKRTAKSGDNSPPSTAKPSSAAFNNYAVAPDLARYIKIPKLKVNARVLQTGVNSSGALGTPSSVFDTAWYTGSAKPGQPGVTLIDGHVSSWTTHGVFYNLLSLAAGDTLQIVKGDGSVVNYQVVKTQLYPANAVDMRAAITPVTAGKSGLNLITCAGQVQKGTSQFSQRVIVFAEQV